MGDILDINVTYACICQDAVDKQLRTETLFSICKVVQKYCPVVEVTYPLLQRLLAFRSKHVSVDLPGAHSSNA